MRKLIVLAFLLVVSGALSTTPGTSSSAGYEPQRLESYVGKAPSDLNIPGNS
jgi:hypothetical protein